MKLQVLVSTMNQKDYSLLDKMNIQSDVIVVNQCDKNSVDEFVYNSHSVKWISMSEKGVGLSRNTSLMNATADIVLFADDDICYYDGYTEAVISAFENNEKADIICFNISLLNSAKNIGGHKNNTKNKRLHFFNSMKYGAPTIAARRKMLFKESVFFSLLFGGGAEFASGEDSIFIKKCLDAKLKLFSSVYCLGTIDDSESSWYRGIDDKFFEDRGMLYKLTFSKIYWLLFIYYAYKLSKINKQYSFMQILNLFRKGKIKYKRYR